MQAKKSPATVRRIRLVDAGMDPTRLEFRASVTGPAAPAACFFRPYQPPVAGERCVKVLLCHNYYRERGGEDQSFDDEAALLEQHGHSVVRYTIHSRDLEGVGRLRLAAKAVWNRAAQRQVRDLIRSERPDLMHCTNVVPVISPSVYAAARREGVPVVQALRNYRLMCPAFSFLRNGQVCEDCLLRAVPWPAVAHGCYQGSRAASAALATALAFHRLRRTWTDAVDVYYTLTEFARGKFIAAGFPADKLFVKANSIAPDLGPDAGRGGYAVFVGRLSTEKGVTTLLDGWKQLAAPVGLKIIGEGPLAGEVAAAAAADARIEWLGGKPLAEVLKVIGDAACLICPSVWYETFGRVIAEAFSRGTPVVASNLGAMAELVDEGVTGRKFPAGDSSALAEVVQRLFAAPAKLANMRPAARAAYESRFTPQRNYQRLMELYELALSTKEEPVRKGEADFAGASEPPALAAGKFSKTARG